jgi:hypothetical protein
MTDIRQQSAGRHRSGSRKRLKHGPEHAIGVPPFDWREADRTSASTYGEVGVARPKVGRTSNDTTTETGCDIVLATSIRSMRYLPKEED